VDIILHPNKGPHLLEVNTSPSMSDTGLFPKALAHSSISMEEFIDHVISLALKHNIRT
jgi:D-alanine-D-alanine ligase-like ATP-grasp enzyme